MNRFKLRKKITCDDRGALEGLPLYLIILVVITAIAIVIMITWLSTMQEPDLDSIEVEVTQNDNAPAGTIYEGDPDAIVTITAKGTNGKELEGVTVKLEGAGIAQTMKTDGNGKATFNPVTPDLPPNTYTGSITVTATYSGNIFVTKTTDIPVNTG
jgi:hypothetical protein